MILITVLDSELLCRICYRVERGLFERSTGGWRDRIRIRRLASLPEDPGDNCKDEDDYGSEADTDAQAYFGSMG